TTCIFIQRRKEVLVMKQSALLTVGFCIAACSHSVMNDGRESTTEGTYPRGETSSASDQRRYGGNTNRSPGPLGTGLDVGTGPAPVDQPATVESRDRGEHHPAE